VAAVAMTSEEELRIYTDGFDWYVAKSFEDLWDLIKERSGETKDDKEGTFQFLRPESKLYFVLSKKTGRIANRDEEEDTHLVQKTAEEWANYLGRGYIGSTEY